jgi:hypothetical protein
MGNNINLAEAVTLQVAASLATWLADWVERLPPPWPSSSHVDMCPRSREPDRLKSWPVGRPIGSFGLGFGPPRPRVKYTPVAIMILTFGQLHFVIR